MSNNATVAQRRRMARVAELGCIACRHDGYFGTPAEIHHCKDHGYRNHKKVCSLCPVHHKPTSSIPGILNRHLNPIEFAEKYGTDEELHRKTCALLGEQP